MSRWRKIALGAVPSCKNAIETAKEPYEMWVSLGLEYIEASGRNPVDVVKMREIFTFSVEVQSRQLGTFLLDDVGQFLALKYAIETMPLRRDFLVQNARSETFSLEL